MIVHERKIKCKYHFPKVLTVDLSVHRILRMSEVMRDLGAVSSLSRPSDLSRPLGGYVGIPPIGQYEGVLPGVAPSTAEERLKRYFIEQALPGEGEKVRRIELEIKAAVDAMRGMALGRVEAVLDRVCIEFGADIIDLQLALRQAVEAAGGDVTTFYSGERA